MQKIEVSQREGHSRLFTTVVESGANFEQNYSDYKDCR